MGSEKCHNQGSQYQSSTLAIWLLLSGPPTSPPLKKKRNPIHRVLLCGVKQALQHEVMHKTTKSKKGFSPARFEQALLFNQANGSGLATGAVPWHRTPPSPPPLLLCLGGLLPERPGMREESEARVVCIGEVLLGWKKHQKKQISFYIYIYILYPRTVKGAQT